MASLLRDIVSPHLSWLERQQPTGTEFEFGDLFDRHQTDVVAVMVPMSGAPGMYGPSCIAATQLAVSEVNARGGIAGRKLDVAFLDSTFIDGFELARELKALIAADAISAVISATSTEMWQWLDNIINGAVPHIYTLSCNGNERAPNSFMIGPTRHAQFVPAIHRLTELLRVRRWALVGRDSLWPHLSRLVARQAIADCGGTIVHESYLPSGRGVNFDAVVEKLVEAGPDIVFMSLVGQDEVEFNRAFGARDLYRRVFRFCEVAGEATLMGSGADNTKGMFATAAYFASLDSEIHLAFQERYYAMHGAAGPAINAHGQSLYEGINFYSALAHCRRKSLHGPIMYPTARGGVFHSNRHKEDPIYLAEADGLRFEVLGELLR